MSHNCGSGRKRKTGDLCEACHRLDESGAERIHTSLNRHPVKSVG